MLVTQPGAYVGRMLAADITTLRAALRCTFSGAAMSFRLYGSQTGGGGGGACPTAALPMLLTVVALASWGAISEVSPQETKCSTGCCPLASCSINTLASCSVLVDVTYLLELVIYTALDHVRGRCGILGALVYFLLGAIRSSVLFQLPLGLKSIGRVGGFPLFQGGAVLLLVQEQETRRKNSFA